MVIMQNAGSCRGTGESLATQCQSMWSAVENWANLVSHDNDTIEVWAALVQPVQVAC